jgi:hypothetical protein
VSYVRAQGSKYYVCVSFLSVFALYGRVTLKRASWYQLSGHLHKVWCWRLRCDYRNLLPSCTAYCLKQSILSAWHSIFEFEILCIFVAQPFSDFVDCIPIIYWYRLLNTFIVPFKWSPHSFKTLHNCPTGAKIYDDRCTIPFEHNVSWIYLVVHKPQ